MAKPRLKDMIWFPCYPKNLLSTLQGMPTHEGYLYLIVMLRIYEDWGVCKDPPEALMRRSGLSRQKFDQAMASLVKAGRVVQTEHGLTNPKCTEIIAEQNSVRENFRKRAAAGGKKKAEKHKQNQQNESAKRVLKSADIEQEVEKESTIGEIPSVTQTPSPPKTAARSAVLSDWPNDYRERFWKRYPRRTEKQAAMKKLEAVRATGLPWATFWGGVERYAKWCVGTEQAYIKHPATWLNRGCWDDELGKPRAQQERGRHRGGAADLLAKMMMERGDDEPASNGDPDERDVPAEGPGDVVELSPGTGYHRH